MTVDIDPLALSKLSTGKVASRRFCKEEESPHRWVTQQPANVVTLRRHRYWQIDIRVSTPCDDSVTEAQSINLGIVLIFLLPAADAAADRMHGNHRFIVIRGILSSLRRRRRSFNSAGSLN